MTSLVSLAAKVEVPELEENHLFMPPWGYGLVAVALFLLLFLFLWSFRNTAARYVQGTANHSHGTHGAPRHTAGGSHQEAKH